MTTEEEAVVDKFFIKELARKRISGPFSIKEMEQAAQGPIRSSPMKVVEKITPPGAPPKFRIVEDNSSPYKPGKEGVTSVNSLLDADDVECTWTSVRDFELWLLSLPSGSTFFGFDFAEGFHQLPTSTQARSHLMLFWAGHVWVRKVASFGVRTTPATFGNLVDATIKIVEDQMDGKVSLRNQVDDVIAARPPKSTTSSTDVLTVVFKLGWELQPSKIWPEGVEGQVHLDWLTDFTHIGIEWDHPEQTKTLQERKRIKYLARLREALKLEAIRLQQLQKVIGYCIYVCCIRPDFKPYLFHMFALQRSFKPDEPWTARKFNRVHKREVETWIELLKVGPVTSSFAELPPFHPTIVMASDACNTGLGIVLGNEAFYWPLVPNWRHDFVADIGAAEAWAVEALVDALILRGARACELHLLCDNEGFIGGWRKGWSRNPRQNEVCIRLFRRTTHFDLKIHLVEVASAINPADPVSRNVRDEDGLFVLQDGTKLGQLDLPIPAPLATQPHNPNHSLLEQYSSWVTEHQ